MKKVIAIFLVLAVISCLTVGAFAANETSASTTVSYTIDDGYIIDIPSSINLNETDYLDITASRMHMSGKYVWVKIDTERTVLSGNSIELRNSTGNSMLCRLSVGNQMDATTRSIKDASYQVAIFENTSTTPTEYGRLFFEVHPELYDSRTYSGIIYFEIGS